MWSFKRNIYRTRREDEVTCPNCINHDVTIGAQTWTGCNANVAFYSNDDPIPYVSDPTAWAGLTTGAWCHYDNDPANEAIYGKLYNWYAINDIRGLAPTGYHVPTDSEWTVLTDYLGGLTVAGGAMKEEGFCHWLPSNTDATNTSLFTGLPGGWRVNDGYYSRVGGYGYWWSSTEYDTDVAWARALFNSNGYAGRGNVNKEDGLSVRFIKDELSCPDCIDHDVTIGTQTWTGCNLDVDKYRNGASIPEVSDPIAWAALTTGAWCWYANDSANGPIYGKLYNWYAINDPRGLAPVGYHIPTDAEWSTLTTFLGGLSVAGGKMKEEGVCWTAPNTDATNISLFSAIGAGSRDIDGSYLNIGNYGTWWSSTDFPTLDVAIYRAISYGLGGVYISNGYKKSGLSIRLIKD